MPTLTVSRPRVKRVALQTKHDKQLIANYFRISQLQEIIYTLECGMRGVATRTQSEEHKQKAYPFIPLPCHRFIQMIEAARDAAPAINGTTTRRSFLDVGAGYGSKVIVARQILGHDWSCNGIEIDQQYVDARIDAGVTLADGRTYGHYHLFDIIYMYCPMCDHSLQAQLTARAIQQAKPGAILILAGCYLDETTYRGQIERVAGNQIYRKV